jgi:acyl-coenzyme A synthetase/AMP-(fatty) acid ligase
MNFAKIILNHARTQPDVTAIDDGERVMTYGELASATRRTASHIRMLGVRPGDRVALCLKDSCDYLVILLAIAYVGAVVAPVDWRARPGEKTRIARGLDLNYAVSEPESPFPHGISVPFDASWRSAVSSGGPLMDAHEDGQAPLMITATSGTTGLPKYTLVTHMMNHLRSLDSRIVGGLPRVRSLVTFPLSFAAGRSLTLNDLHRGATVVVRPTVIDADLYAAAVSEANINLAYCPPPTARQLLKLAPSQGFLFPTLAALQTSATPMSGDEKREIASKISPNYYENFASTAASTIAVMRASDLAEHADSVGQVLAMMDAEIVDENDQPLPPGGIGQLRVRGPKVATPLNLAGEPPSDEFRLGWNYTGDIASVDERMYLYIRGRSSEVIVRRGAKIFPAEIEGVLQAHERVAEAAVVAVAGAGGDDSSVAFVVARGPLTLGELVAYCRGRLTAYKVPQQFILVEALPRTNAGKVDKLDLQQQVTPKA